MKKKKDYFATSILSESINLQFDSEGRIALTKLLEHSKLKTAYFLLVKEKHFKYGNQLHLKNLGLMPEKSNINRNSLKWEKQFNN